jgi:hypothetical protein
MYNQNPDLLVYYQYIYINTYACVYSYYIIYMYVYNRLCLQQLYVHMSISTVVAPASPVEAFRPRGDDATVLVETCPAEIGVSVMSGCRDVMVNGLV